MCSRCFRYFKYFYFLIKEDICPETDRTPPV